MTWIRIAAAPLAPLLLVQGRLVRRRIVRLPEPEGARAGVTGAGPRLRLVVLGDSAAAGVGASHQSEALLGRVVERLAPRFRVEWELLAKSGATTASTLRSLGKLRRRVYDVAVTSLGVNDVTGGLSRAGWRREQRALRAALRSDFGIRAIVLSGLPPVHGFPALPQPLRWYLGARARHFDRDLEQDVRTEPGSEFVSLDFARDVEQMAEDGYHPGPEIYAAWGRRVADAVLRRAG